MRMEFWRGTAHSICAVPQVKEGTRQKETQVEVDVNRTAYYEAMASLAAAKRNEFGVTTANVGLRELRHVYGVLGIKIDLWKLSPRIRAVYMSESGDPSVLVNKNLPPIPRLFSMAHELKHHFCDREAIENGKLRCGDYNANQVIEIGAEVFAAEFIYPEQEFCSMVEHLKLKPGAMSADDVVRLKRDCGAPVSYKFLQKRLERLGYIQADQFDNIQFQKLEETIYGQPIYKQKWFQMARARKARKIASRRSPRSL
jgi:Zn-dependent peptidase ImmA (M78 family)